jgi:carboxymethylenebutenolidase
MLAALSIGAGPGRAAEPRSEEVTFQRRDGQTIRALLVRPEDGGRNPAIVILHGAGGATESHKAYARRLAEAGFVALLPDLASIRLRPSEPAGLLRNEIAGAVSLLKGRREVDGGRLGLLGFAQGGERALFAAISFPTTFKAVVQYYSPIAYAPMNLELAAGNTASKIRSPVLILHGEDDQLVPVEHARQLEEALRLAGKPFEIIFFPGADHGFDQEGEPWYNPVAAREAETSVLAFFARHLKSP